MEQSNTNINDSPEEKVDGGCLPDWEVADLPAPPPYPLQSCVSHRFGTGNYCARRINRQRRMAARSRNHRTVRRTTPLDRYNRHPTPILHQYRSNSLHNLYRGTDVQRLYALQTGIAILGVLLFGYRFLRNLARLGSDRRHSDCSSMVGIYAGGSRPRYSPPLCVSGILPMSRNRPVWGRKYTMPLKKSN